MSRWYTFERPADVPPSRELVRAAMQRRGLIKRVAKGSTNQASSGARRVLREYQEAQAREADPVQRAVRDLRKLGYLVSLDEAGTWRAGTRGGLTGEQVIALAAKVAG